MKLVKSAFLAGILVLTGANKADWNTTVVETDAGHLIGNPEADHKLVEYISYTCSHCATFARVGDPALKIAYIHGGKVSVEIRHLLRDPIDLTAALLTHCGDTNRFALNHNAFMYSQEKWLPIARSASQAQVARWTNSDRAAARRAIATDFGFYKLMEARGYEVSEINRCLADDTLAQTLANATRDAAVTYGIRGTPSFVLDGELLEGTHSWPALQERIDATMSAAASD